MEGASPPRLAGLPLVRRTAHEVVVVKPADVPSEMTSDREGISIVSRLRAALPDADVQLPHRLDRPTRGLLVAALSRDAVARHNEHIRAGRWKKFYLARVPAGASLVGVHRAYLRRDGRIASVVRSGGDPSELEVLAEAAAPCPTHRPERGGEGVAGGAGPGERHLLIRLDTGRYHQIRAMLGALGSPLVGDAVYGGRPGTMYLEHAVLVLVDLDSGASQRLFRADDPEREAVDPRISAALRRCGQ